MENKEIKIKCYKCGEQFTSSEMRYDPDKPNQLACKACLSRDNAPVTEARAQEPNEENLKYYCVKCNYKFLRRKSIKVDTCPYCGASNSLTTKTDINTMMKTSDSEVFEK